MLLEQLKRYAKKCVRIPGVTSRFDSLAAEQSDLGSRIDALSSGQLIIGGGIRDLAQVAAVNMTIDAITDKHARPSKAAWWFAGVFLVSSVAMIGFGILANVTISTQESSADMYHRQAQSERDGVIELLAGGFGVASTINSPIRFTITPLTSKEVAIIFQTEKKELQDQEKEKSASLKILSTSNAQMQNADQLDSLADQVTVDVPTLEVASQILLGVGPVMLGAVASWGLTLALAQVKSKRELQEESVQLESLQARIRKWSGEEAGERPRITIPAKAEAR